MATHLLAAAPAFAAEPSEAQVTAALERAAPLGGKEWIAARDALLGLGREARASIVDRAKSLTFSRVTWREDVAVEIVAAHATDPDLAKKILALDGLTPAKYLARRRPEPEVGRELARLSKAGPFLAELLLKTASEYPFAARSAYPAKLGDREVTSLREKERLALLTGAVEALATSKHPAAAYVLEELAKDEKTDLAVRRAATIGLGTTTGGETTLVTLARDAKAPKDVRTGALAGLGQVRTRSALDVLVELGTRTEDVELRRASISAVGALATASAMKRVKAPMAQDLRERATAWLIDTLASRRGAEHEDELVEALAMTADRGALQKLSRRLAEGGDREDVKERLEHARSRLARAVTRER